MIRKIFFILFLIFIISFFIPSCYYPEEISYICILSCNPADYLVLDEEDCECVPDLDAIREIICDGDVENCDCKEDDRGRWCTALTGDSIKTWKMSGRYNPITGDTIISSFQIQSGWESYTTYRLDHIKISYIKDRSESSITSITSWEFDNVFNPGKIISKHPTNAINIDTEMYPEKDYYSEMGLMKLDLQDDPVLLK